MQNICEIVSMQYTTQWNENLGSQQQQNFTYVRIFYTKMGDFNIMTQNSILIDFNLRFTSPRFYEMGHRYVL